MHSYHIFLIEKTTVINFKMGLTLKKKRKKVCTVVVASKVPDCKEIQSRTEKNGSSRSENWNLRKQRDIDQFYFYDIDSSTF